MIYLDTSVALAHLLGEDLRPPALLWEQDLVSSRLLQLEIWTRLNARGLGESHADAASELIARVALVEMTTTTLERALEPFEVPVRTLDAIHLASADFLRRLGQEVKVASYDLRLMEAAEAMGFEAAL